MAENTTVNAEQKQNKRFRIGYIFLGLVPFAIIMAVQTAATIPGVILAVVDIVRSGRSYDLATIMEIFNSKYALAVYCAYCVICLAVFLPWYNKGVVKKNNKVDYKKALGPRPLALSVSAMICMFFLVSGGFVIFSRLLPAIMEKYNELIELSSVGTNTLITIIYVIILGPLTEELCYRGLMFGIMEKSNANHLIIIAIQGVLFGIMHMNVVQGAYAFLLGILLGYLRYRYKTVILTVGVHMMFNIVGTYGAQFLEDAGMTDDMAVLFGGIATAVLILLMIPVIKDKNVYTKEREPQQVIS